MEFMRVELSHREDIINHLQQELKSIRGQYDSLLVKVPNFFSFSISYCYKLIFFKS